MSDAQPRALLALMDDVELALFERQVEALEKIAEHLEYLTGAVDALSIKRQEPPTATKEVTP